MTDRRLLSIALASAVSMAVTPFAAAAPEAPPAPAATSAPQAGISPDWMDRTVKPGDDFYSFADGAWQKTTEIPADRSSIGGFYIADNTTEQQLAALLARVAGPDAAPDAEAGSDVGRIRDYYNAYLDTDAIEAAGMAPVAADLARFAAIRTRGDLSRVLGAQIRADVDPFNATDFQTENLFGVFVTQALAGGEVEPYLLQGGLGLPEREYYLSDDPKMLELRTAYRAYIAKLLGDAGIAEDAAAADGMAARIFDLETKIAKAHVTRAQSENFQQSADQWSRPEFATRAPGIDWDAFFKAARLGDQPRFSVYHAAAIPQLSALVQSEPLAAWRDWLAFHQINAHAGVLPQRIDADHFAFFDQRLQGIEAQRPRPKRAIQALNSAMGDALGRLYVERYFPASSKAEIERMAGAIKQAFARRVEAIDWMAPATKAQALEKVRNIEVSVGYPDHWHDYSDLKVGAKTAYANMLAAEALRYRQQLAKIGKPLDRREWWMNAQLVDAVNLPVQNALNFPAAILQRPFFARQADMAFNYGAVGAVIGHEISHSFDNNGAAFDASGRMRNWWTPQDLARFEQAGKALAEQYDAYEPLPGLHVNGELTLGENIADLSGLTAAYDAYHASLGGKPAPVIGGLTGDQRFFIAYAQTWATKMREATLRKRIATDGHAPGGTRALTVRNLDAWYDAFGVKPGDALYLPPEQRVTIW